MSYFHGAHRTNPHDLGMADTGEKVIFLDENGYEGERSNARDFFTKGQVLTVADISIGGWASSYKFEEVPDKFFNTVMFKPVEPTSM
jgi:hypothetical protein